MKKKGGITGWKVRYFVVSNATNSLDYYEDEEKKILKRSIEILPSSRIEKGANIDGYPHILILHGTFEGKEKVTIMTASDENAQNLWFNAFDQIINGINISLPEINAFFRNTCPVSITFSPSPNHDGNLVSTMTTQSCPSIEFEPKNSHYALIMTDPDAPARDDPAYRYVANIDISFTIELLITIFPENSFTGLL
jgi:hypothetical protein